MLYCTYCTTGYTRVYCIVLIALLAALGCAVLYLLHCRLHWVVLLLVQRGHMLQADPMLGASVCRVPLHGMLLLCPLVCPSACYVGCTLTCVEGGPQGCTSCADGFIWHNEEGCIGEATLYNTPLLPLLLSPPSLSPSFPPSSPFLPLPFPSPSLPLSLSCCLHPTPYPQLEICTLYI